MEKNICRAAKVLLTKMLHYKNYIETVSLSKILGKFKHVMIDTVLIERLLCPFVYIITSHEGMFYLNYSKLLTAFFLKKH